MTESALLVCCLLVVGVMFVSMVLFITIFEDIELIGHVWSNRKEYYLSLKPHARVLLIVLLIGMFPVTVIIEVILAILSAHRWLKWKVYRYKMTMHKPKRGG